MSQAYTGAMLMQDTSPDALPWLTWTFAALVMLQAFTRLWLLSRQVQHVQANRSAVPDSFSDRVSLLEHQKAADYSGAKARLAFVAVAVEAAVLLGWTLLGGLDLLNTSLRGWIHDPAPSASSALTYPVALLLAMGLIAGLI